MKDVYVYIMIGNLVVKWLKRFDDCEHDQLNAQWPP